MSSSTLPTSKCSVSGDGLQDGPRADSRADRQVTLGDWAAIRGSQATVPTASAGGEK